MTLYRITSPYFVAGVETDDLGVLIRAAPIIKYAFKLGIKNFINYCDKKKWKVEILWMKDQDFLEKYIKK